MAKTPFHSRVEAACEFLQGHAKDLVSSLEEEMQEAAAALDFEKAAEAYIICMTYSDNPDSICATVDWHYMTLRRLGQPAEAAELLNHITPDMDLIESHSYHYRLMMYKGVYTPEQLLNPTDNRPEDRLLTLATQGYGVGSWYLYNGDHQKAIEIYNQVLETGFWSAFGYIAAEAELLTDQSVS